MSPDIRVYGILDPAAMPGGDLPALGRLSVQGGATLLQYRDKHADGLVMVQRARAILAALAGSGVPLVINDRVDVALAAAAQGVHLGQSDIAPADARAVLGPAAIIGRSLGNEADIRAMVHEPVDYGCIGAVFATRNKDDADTPMGLDGLARLAALARDAAVPVGAIAGISAANAAQVIAAGADGVAVISAIFGEADPLAATRALRRIVVEALDRRGRSSAS